MWWIFWLLGRSTVSQYISCTYLYNDAMLLFCPHLPKPRLGNCSYWRLLSNSIFYMWEKSAQLRWILIIWRRSIFFLPPRLPTACQHRMLQLSTYKCKILEGQRLTTENRKKHGEKTWIRIRNAIQKYEILSDVLSLHSRSFESC